MDVYDTLDFYRIIFGDGNSRVLIVHSKTTKYLRKKKSLDCLMSAVAVEKKATVWTI